jgi:hypothetical protein
MKLKVYDLRKEKINKIKHEFKFVLQIILLLTLILLLLFIFSTSNNRIIEHSPTCGGYHQLGPEEPEYGCCKACLEKGINTFRVERKPVLPQYGIVDIMCYCEG